MIAVAGSAQTVDEVIAKNIEAKGGLAKLKAVQSIRITGSVEFNGVQADMVQVLKRPHKMRREITLQGMTMVQAYDGQNGWQIIPFTGKKDPEPMSADDLRTIDEQTDMDGTLVDYKQKGHKVELIGKEKIEGTDVYHLKVTMKNGDVRDMYLDADSFLEIKSKGKTTRRGTEMDVDATIGDYKEVEGLMLPFSMEQHFAGAPGGGQKITIQKVELNVPEDEAQFRMPAVAPAEKNAAVPAGKPESGVKPPQD
jgi:hypothetical protein